MTYNSLLEIQKLEKLFLDCDWFAIMQDGGENALKEYAEYMMNRNN